MKRNMLTRREGPLVITRQNTDEPTESDWNEYLRLLAAQLRETNPNSLRILVYTDGGAMSSEQRKRLAQTLGDCQPKVACISNSVKVRFAGAMIALFQRNYRQFSVAEMKQAFGHLELKPAQREFAEKVLYELEADLYSDWSA